MKRAALILSALFLLVGLSGCGPDPDTDDPDTPNTDPTEPVRTQLLFDEKLAQGIAVSGLESQQVAYTWWKYGDADAGSEPFWSLGQYCNLSNTRENYDSSVNDLSLGTIFDDPKGIEGQEGSYYTLTNRSGSKTIKVDPEAGAVTLNVDTTKEYVDQETGEIVPRKDGEDWVHMILEQSPGTVYLDQVESFVMSLDFTLDRCEVTDDSIGAAQFQWIFGVHDKTSPIGDYFWFNVTLFDDRYEIFPGTQMYDGGKADATGKFIYAPTGEELFGESGGKVEVGVTYHVELDLKKYMKEAFDIAQSMGAMEQSSWEDLSVSGFNLGWEVSNVCAVGVTIENLSLVTETIAS